MSTTSTPDVVSEALDHTSNSSDDYYGDYYYYYDAEAIINSKEWSNACHEFETSIFFLITFAVVLIGLITYIVLVLRKRILVTCLDIVLILIVILV